MLVLAAKLEAQRFTISQTPARETERITDKDKEPRIHIESHNQQGGITAYNVNIAPGDRQLSQTGTDQLKGYLDSVDFKKIDITAAMGDAEAFRFASQIKNYLTSEGHEVSGVHQALSMPPMQGQKIEPPNDSGLVKIRIGSR